MLMKQLVISKCEQLQKSKAISLFRNNVSYCSISMFYARFLSISNGYNNEGHLKDEELQYIETGLQKYYLNLLAT
jgi:hypothetical protein